MPNDNHILTAEGVITLQLLFPVQAISTLVPSLDTASSSHQSATIVVVINMLPLFFAQVISPPITPHTTYIPQQQK